jgi:multisubunit Na+/H+ antiporter MnhG subunit
MTDLIHNEQTKLYANALDRASTALLTVGIVTPIAGFLYYVAGFGASIGVWRLAASVIGWISASVALHYLARRVLKGLRS